MAVENNAVASFVNDGREVVSWKTVLDKATEQGVQMWLVSPDNHTDLYRMPLPQDVHARVRERLAEGQLVMIPERAVIFGEGEEASPQYRWLVYDSLTGRVDVENAEGWHDVVFVAGKEDGGD